jgi:hypothetical protein
MTSLKVFKKEFLERLLDIHWQQWTTLGVSSHLEQESNTTIDLEALMLSTLHAGKTDKRLLTVAMEWTSENRQWVNLSRINRIARHYITAKKPLNAALVTPEVHSLFLRYLTPNLKSTGETDALHKARRTASTGNELSTYTEIFRMARGKGATVVPNLRHPRLLQLYFRGVFGINARAEVYLYLLLQKRGNSRHIAKEIGFDQKIVYRILESWSRAGLVEKADGKNYELLHSNTLKTIVPVTQLPRYINWIGAFVMLGKIFSSIGTEPFAADEYLLSSFFREILPDARILARTVDLSFSDDRLYPGADYCEVFSNEMIDVLKKI